MGKVVKAVVSVGALVAGIVTGNPFLISAGISGIGSSIQSVLAKKPKPQINRASADRLHATIDPGTARKLAFGRTAMSTDVRYQAFTGTDKEYYWQIVCVASHKVEAIEELWLDDKQAWTSSGGVTASFTNYLQVTAITEGSSANVQSIDSNWGAAANTRLTGCAYLSIRFKLTGSNKKTESPFASSIPSRMTIVGKGMRVYDPRLDTTVGGSGSHRADDQTTWEYSHSGSDIGRNPALQQLTWLLGWKINSKLAVGRGVPPERIDMDSFIAAANLCEEGVSLSAGGTEPRYRFDGVFAEDEDGGAILTTFNASMAGILRDNGGKLALFVLHDDLSSPVMSLTEADVIGPFDWQQTPPLDQRRNVVRGKYTDPSNNSLYQLVDYPSASLTAPDGIDRILTYDLPGVQSVTQAQRLAKQALQRNQYGGVFTCPLNAKAWGLLLGDVVEWDLSSLGWSGKLMRLVERTIRSDGVSDCVFAEENSAIYAWSTGDEQTPVTAASPTSYDWTKNPWQQANIEDNADVTLRIKGAAKSTVACDYTGAAKTGQLTKTLTFELIRGTAETNVTSSATWGCSITSGSGTVANNATKGKVDLSAINTDRIEITVTATYGTSTRTFVHVVEKLIDAPPVSGGGGGSGGSSASDSSIADTTSSSYGTTNAGPLTVTAGASGIVDLSFPGSFTRTTSGSGTAFGKWQWRIVGGTYADVSTEIASVVSSNTNTTDGTYDPGSIYVTQQKTGLTAGTSYEFILLLRNGGSYTQNWTGTASAVGS